MTLSLRSGKEQKGHSEVMILYRQRQRMQQRSRDLGQKRDTESRRNVTVIVNQPCAGSFSCGN